MFLKPFVLCAFAAKEKTTETREHGGLKINNFNCAAVPLWQNDSEIIIAAD
jgi:hypothetical protein